MSGFRLIPDGFQALALRLALIERAQSQIDAQYYEIEDDFSGHIFIEALLHAANRGVTVRLLMDDFLTAGHDAEIAALQAHENFNLKIYNPFKRNLSRALESILSFSRINRRMHNKSLTIDNQLSIIGGRNIGNGYFNVSSTANFCDLDLLCIGPVVGEISTMFKQYWESPAAVPLQVAMHRFQDYRTSLSRLLDRIARKPQRSTALKLDEDLKRQAKKLLRGDLDAFTWAPYQLAFDLPEKTHSREKPALVRQLMVEAFRDVHDEVILVSPYFVPRRSGVNRFKNLRDRGIRVAVITNSLASNNQIYAHGGYAPVRKPLLKQGVELYELRADAETSVASSLGKRSDGATLHTKAFVIDRKKLFVGSFNFDPRSANINTEMGVFIDSPRLAKQFAEGAEQHFCSHSYQLFLSRRNQLRWRGWDNGIEFSVNQEPQTNNLQRFLGRVAQLLPIRGQI